MLSLTVLLKKLFVNEFLVGNYVLKPVCFVTRSICSYLNLHGLPLTDCIRAYARACVRTHTHTHTRKDLVNCANHYDFYI